MNTEAKPKPNPEFRMDEAEFDEAMRKAFGVPPPPTKPKPERPKVKERRPKPTERI